MSIKHYDQNESDGVHQIYNWVWANQAALDAEAPTDPLLVNKIGLKSDTVELWQLVDLTPTWVRVGKADISVEFTVGALVGTARAVSLQLVANGVDVTESLVIDVWVAETVDGEPTPNDPDNGVTIDDGLELISYGVGISYKLKTDAGFAQLTLDSSVTFDYYLVVVLPDGRLVSSAVIAF